MDNLAGYIATGVVTFVVGLLLQWFQAKPHVVYWTPHWFRFNLKEPEVALQTDALTVQNLGRQTAEDIELIMNTRPDFFQFVIPYNDVINTGFSASGADASVTKNHTTVGMVPGGANVEEEEVAEIVESGEITEEEAREERHESNDKDRNERNERIYEHLKEEKPEIAERFKENREEVQEKIQDKREKMDEKRIEVKEKIQEKRDVIKNKKEDLQERQVEKREDLQGLLEERKEVMQERQAEKKEDFQDRRDGNRLSPSQ